MSSFRSVYANVLKDMLDTKGQTLPHGQRCCESFCDYCGISLITFTRVWGMRKTDMQCCSAECVDAMTK